MEQRIRFSGDEKRVIIEVSPMNQAEINDTRT